MKAHGLFENIDSLLNVASFTVVAIAVIFAGCRIAFGRKRLAEVSPVMVGGLMIGGACQFLRSAL